METSSDNSDECSVCYETLKSTEEIICNTCLNSTIKYWSCNRCGNCWSSEYCDERNYSDCCMGMMEWDNKSLENIKYCDNTHITVYENNKICNGCMKDKLPQCKKLIKAYTQEECKLKEY